VHISYKVSQCPKRLRTSSFSVYSHDELDAIADSLNNRPRATDAFHSLFAVFAATLASASQPQGAKH
jgi:IS30 family transposase